MVLFAVFDTFAVFAETAKVGSPAACVTVIVLLVAPVAEIVTVAIRVVMNGLADEVVTVSVPFPEDPVLTVSQPWSELVAHVALEVTVIFAVLLVAFATFTVVAETDKVASPTACVTVIVLLVTPVAVTVTVAVRVVINGLADVVVKVSVPFPVPEFTLSQPWSELAAHVALEVTVIFAVLLAVFATEAVIDDTVNFSSLPSIAPINGGFVRATFT